MLAGLAVTDVLHLFGNLLDLLTYVNRIGSYINDILLFSHVINLDGAGHKNQLSIRSYKNKQFVIEATHSTCIPCSSCANQFHL